MDEKLTRKTEKCDAPSHTTPSPAVLQLRGGHFFALDFQILSVILSAMRGEYRLDNGETLG
jgi:hypothetical protein